ncbi:MAG: FAD binding domain-containing protein [Terriglobales bacterium]
MIPANFDYEAPGELQQALDMLASREDAKALAGGHSLLPAMKLRLAQPALLVDLGRLPGLSYIRGNAKQIHIGAMTTHAEVAASALLRTDCPLLPQAASEIGDIQVRNRGTIGGSLAHADPSADYPGAVLALDAEIVAMSKRGERVIPAREFFTGLFTTSLAPDELIVEIRVPITTPAATTYKKFAHPASGMAVVGVAAVVKMRGNMMESVAIGINGVAHWAYRAAAVENALRGKLTSAIPEAAEHAADGVEALGDYFASADYRCHMARVYTRRALEEIAGAHRK